MDHCGGTRVDYRHGTIKPPATFYDYWRRPFDSDQFINREPYQPAHELLTASHQRHATSPYLHTYNHQQHHRHHQPQHQQLARGSRGDVTRYDDVMESRCVTSFIELQPASRSRLQQQQRTPVNQSLEDGSDWPSTSATFLHANIYADSGSVPTSTCRESSSTVAAGRHQFNADERQCVKCGSPTSGGSCWSRDDTGHYLCCTCSLYQNVKTRPDVIHDPARTTPVKNITRKSTGQSRRYGLVCVNCGCTTSTLWRRNSDGETVCNACGLYFKLHGINRPASMRKEGIQTRKRRPKGPKPPSTGRAVCDAVRQPALTDSDEASSVTTLDDIATAVKREPQQLSPSSSVQVGESGRQEVVDMQPAARYDEFAAGHSAGAPPPAVNDDSTCYFTLASSTTDSASNCSSRLYNNAAMRLRASPTKYYHQQKNAVESYATGGSGGCTAVEMPYYGVGCLPSGAIAVTHHDVIASRCEANDYVTDHVIYYSPTVQPSHYVRDIVSYSSMA